MTASKKINKNELNWRESESTLLMSATENAQSLKNSCSWREIISWSN